METFEYAVQAGSCNRLRLRSQALASFLRVAGMDSIAIPPVGEIPLQDGPVGPARSHGGPPAIRSLNRSDEGRDTPPSTRWSLGGFACISRTDGARA